MNMAFRKEERSCRTPPGCRLATVEEAKDNLELIKQSNLLEEWDRARLLNGWIGGSAYDFKVEEAFRSCLGYMLVIESPTPEIINTDDRNGVLYSDVPKLSKEAWNASLLLCCEDWNKDVLYRLIAEETKHGWTREDAIWEGDETEVASKLVSKIAREWQNVHAKGKERRTGFSLASLQDLRIHIPQFLNDLAVDTNKSLKGLMDENQNSEQGRNVNNILKDHFPSIETVVYNVFRGIGLTEDLKMFKEFGFDTIPPSTLEVIADTVWDITVDATIHVSTTDLCSRLYYKVVRRSGQAGTQTMDDCSVPASVIRYAYDIFDKSLPKLLEEAGREAKGDCERFCQILSDQRLRMSSCEREFDGLRTFLVRAAKAGNVDLVKMLTDRGVELAAKDENGQTALHHAFRGKQPNEELVQVLIQAEGKKSVDGSARLVDVEDNVRKTPLDLAIQNDTNVNMVVSLLSLSSQPESYFKNLQLSLYLRESSRMGYTDLVEKLLNEGADVFDPDDEGKTALHCAAEGEEEHVAGQILQNILVKVSAGDKNVEKVSVGDKYGRNALHVAAFLGREKLCSLFFKFNRNVDTEDRDGQSAIYYAVAGAHDDIGVLNTILAQQGTNQVFVKDFSQTTPLHMAASRGNRKMVEELLSKISEQERRMKYVEAPDVLGQTALHKAASGGHYKVVEKLLDEGAHPLKERDCDRKTALHFAAEAGDEDAVEIAKLLLEKCESDEQKVLLLYASAVGIGFHNSWLERYLEGEKLSLLPQIPKSEDLLKVAAKLGDIDMAREFIARGANIALIRNEQWRNDLQVEENKNVENVLKKIEKIVEQATDKPSQQDNLGRTPFAIGLAAIFLNPFVKSPITVGISGEWGTGKSSVMMQTESILLKTAAHLAFSKSFPGASESKLSVTGQARLNIIANEIERLSGKRQDGHNIIEKIGMSIKRLMNFTEEATDSQNSSRSPDFLLQNYEPKYHQIFKSLAIMDRCDMFEKKEERRSGNQNVGVMPWDEDPIHGTPHCILTVRYNAWHYRNETEAWAGLAVEITKELEATMTVAHGLRTNWIYNWRNQKNNICFGVLLPYFLTVMLTIFFTIIGWLLLDTTQNKDISKVKYGCLPVSMIVIAWSIGKSLISMVKPISSQVLDYICLPDHRHKLGYHHQVISDINFLKAELHYRPSSLWKAFACIWCFITRSRNENYVPGTTIPKMPSAFGNNLRIIVFVDDLDRCEENVILRVLSAVHLVLATCEINVILSMENSMIKRAIMRKYGKGNSKAIKSNEDFAENYLRKIVQLPLHIPDPSDSESREFLQSQLGPWDPKKESAHPAVETERTTTYMRRKANPKFQIGTPRKPQLARGETHRHSAESGAEQQSDHRVSDRAQQRLGDTVQQDISEHPEGSRVDATIEIPDQTTGIEQQQNRTEPGENQPMAGDQDRQSQQSFKDLSLIISRMLIPMYTEGEKNAFHFLHARSTRNKKIPREWKCFMAYHRLAWNILSLSPDILPVEGWQIQLIVWIFVCWQWSNLITTLIQKWNNLGVLRKWKVTEEHSGPSLREIVEHYIDERWPVNKKNDNFQGDIAIKMKDDAIDSPSSTEEVGKTSDILPEKNMTTISSEEDTKGVDHLTQARRKVLEEQEEIRAKSLKEQEEIKAKSLKEQAEMKNMLKMLMKKVFDEDIFMEEEERSLELYKTDEEKQKSEKVKDEEEREEWSKLKETLRYYNVSMDGIQAFQKFRFYCEPGYLPWPLPKQA